MRDVVRAAAAVAREPRLWLTALVAYRRLLPDRWWRRRPFLPAPDPAMVRFRAVTQYGDPGQRPLAGDVIAWLWWCKAENQRQRIR